MFFSPLKFAFLFFSPFLKQGFHFMIITLSGFFPNVPGEREEEKRPAGWKIPGKNQNTGKIKLQIYNIRHFLGARYTLILP